MSRLLTEGTRFLPYGILLNNLFDYLGLNKTNPHPVSGLPIDISILVRTGHETSESSRKRRAIQTPSDGDTEDEIEQMFRDLSEHEPVAKEEEEGEEDDNEHDQAIPFGSDDELAPLEPNDPFFNMVINSNGKSSIAKIRRSINKTEKFAQTNPKLNKCLRAYLKQFRVKEDQALKPVAVVVDGEIDLFYASLYLTVQLDAAAGLNFATTKAAVVLEHLSAYVDPSAFVTGSA